MGENSSIEWTDHTFNPWIGCTKVSAGCTHCYAEQLMDKRYGRVVWGKGNPRQMTSKGNWANPKRWNKDAAKKGIRYRVFCASLADVFDAEVPDEWREKLFELIFDTPHLDWLLLTKRPENVLPFMDKACFPSSGCPMFPDGVLPANVWMGTSVENQEAANKRVPVLMQIPAGVRFLSCEPLIGAVDLTKIQIGWEYPQGHESRQPRYIDAFTPRTVFGSEGDYHFDYPINWVIAGGESGTGARPMHPDWARSLRDQCQAVGAAFLFKQWGEYLPVAAPRLSHKGLWTLLKVDSEIKKNVSWGDVMALRGDWWAFERVGKHAAGRMLDGRTWDEFPTAYKPPHLKQYGDLPSPFPVIWQKAQP